MNANWEEINFELERKSALISELQSQLAALQWRPITDADIPRAQDDVELYNPKNGAIMHLHHSYAPMIPMREDFTFAGWQYYRKLNLPIAPPADKAGA